MSEYKQVDLQIGTEAQFETKKATLPEGTLVGLTDPIHENELDSALQTKLNGMASTSYVQGNPTESGTVDLTKLKVGNIVYNVPQGGSDINVVQSMGQSTTDVMSQKAVTDSLANKASTSYVQGNPLGSGTTTLTKLKVGNTIYNVPQGGSSVNVAQTTGQSTTAVMSQKAVTDELNGKVDKVTGRGLSTNDFTNDEKNKLAGIETGESKKR